MALNEKERLEIRLQTLYDIRNVFRGSSFSDIRTYVDEIIRDIEADLGIVANGTEDHLTANTDAQESEG